MTYQIACGCGNVLAVTESQAGSSVACRCGRLLCVPSLRELSAHSITEKAPLPEAARLLPAANAPEPDQLTMTIQPTQLWLRTEGGLVPAERKPVMATVTAATLWLQDTWQTRTLALSDLERVEALRNGRELLVFLRFRPAAERWTLTFANHHECERWYRELRAQQQGPELAQSDHYVPEGVSLVRKPPDVPYQLLGRVSSTDKTAWAADRGVQLRAGILGADAVIEVVRHKGADGVWGAHHVNGKAVRIEDWDNRQRLRLRWYAEEVRSLVNRMLLVLIIQAALLFMVSVFCAGQSRLNMPTGETLSQALVSAGIGLGLIYAWPLIMLVLLRFSLWPRLLRTAGVAVLAATTARGLTVFVAHLTAVVTTGAAPASSQWWAFVDPVDWAFIVIGVVLCIRSWRLDREARQILPQEVLAVSTARLAGARSLFAISVTYALALIGFVGVIRYQASSHLVQPGVDPRREQLARVALNEGIVLADKGELAGADEAIQRSLRLWEELTAAPSAPQMYRLELAMTLRWLGYVRELQARPDDAATIYSRAVKIADNLAGKLNLDDGFKQDMATARQFVEFRRNAQLFKDLDEKERVATRKFEDANIHSAKGTAEGEKLYQDAIQLWEEILPKAVNEVYRKYAVGQLATAYLQLGGLQQRLGKITQAEDSLKKAIDYGEKAVAQEPERPLFKHNLQMSRLQLDGVQEQLLEGEINKLYGAKRFGEAFKLSRQSIADREEQFRKDPNTWIWRLSHRLDRFAWLLAQCPDKANRDAKAAIQFANRATELQPGMPNYWYTLAMAQYRDGQWAASLNTLEKVKAKQAGTFDASDWFLEAMNRHQLKQPAEARTAMRKAVEWIENQQKLAEGNLVVRLQLDSMRPTLDSLRQEAESLIGKDSSHSSSCQD